MHAQRPTLLQGGDCQVDVTNGCRLQNLQFEDKKSQTGSSTLSSAALKSDKSEFKTPIFERGTKGLPVAMLTNYIKLNCQQNYGVYEYEVRFTPNIEAKNLRFRYLAQHKAIIGDAQSFDGVTLYLPKRHDDMVLKSVDLKDGSEVIF